MASIQTGNKVRIKDRKDWPKPPGYRLANAEGTVLKAETEGDFQDYILVQLEKAEGEGRAYIGKNLYFRVENLRKI